MRIALFRSLGFVGASIMVLMADVASSDVIIETSGATDPSVNGFGLGGSGGDIGTDTEGHWYMSGFPGSASNFQTSLDPVPHLQDPSGWTATVRVRSEATGDNIQNTHIQVTDATDAWIIGLLDDGPSGSGAYVWNTSYLAGARLGTVLPNEYHTYQMIYDPAGDGGNGVVKYWIDGVNTGIQQSRADVSPDGPNRFLMGNNTGGGTLDWESRWSLARFETGQHPIAPLAVPGDFDADGDVDGADFVVWQTHFPTAGGATLADGDADADGDVDGADFVVWQTNFPFTPGSSVAPVPEPESFLLLAISGIIAMTLRGRR